jgi:hypothetical protein
MSMMRTLVGLAILALAPVSVTALELAHDDGVFGGFESRNPFEADVVQFVLPTPDPYVLQSVRIFLSPFGGTPGPTQIDLHVWGATLTDVYSQTFNVGVTGADWYDLDVSAANLLVDDTFRVGFFWVDGTASAGLLGLDGSVVTGDSYIFASTVPTWIQNTVGLTERGGRGRPRPAYSLEDVNGDGFVDAVAFFSVPELVGAGALTETTTSLTLAGALVNGRTITGEDEVRVVR